MKDVGENARSAAAMRADLSVMAKPTPRADQDDRRGSRRPLMHERMLPRQLDLSWMGGKLMLTSASFAPVPAGPHVTVGGIAWAGWVCHGRGRQALECLRNGRDHGEARGRHSL